MKFIDINGTTLHYTLDGDPNGEPLLLIHSLGTDLRIWDDLIPHLEPAPRVIRFDLRGHGLSRDPAGDLSLSAFSSDVVALLDHFDIAQATVLGLSIGGLISWSYVWYRSGGRLMSTEVAEFVADLVLAMIGARSSHRKSVGIKASAAKA